MADATTQDSPAASPRSGVTLAERHMNPETLMAMGPPPRQALFGVLGIAAILVFIVLALVLWMEHSALSGI